MKATIRTKLITIFSTLNVEDFNEVISLVKEARDRMGQITINTLAVGDAVSFNGRKFGVLKGHIIKINKTTAIVRLDSNTLGFGYQTWRVEASILKKI